MIGYIEGKILKMTQDGILLLAGHVGYEIILPVFVMEKIVKNPLNFSVIYPSIDHKSDNISNIASPATETFNSTSNQIALFIYYHQTDRQPKPILIGFNSEEEKDFFQAFISVDAIGPLKAVKAMEKPISEIAKAIENQDIDFLSNLKGIGKRTAQKIVADLHGKLSRFISESNNYSKLYSDSSTIPVNFDYADNQSAPLTLSGESSLSMQQIFQQVVDVLIEQLGYTSAIAKKMVNIAMQKKPSISTPEELFEAVLHGRL
ncbi:MAG: Holliday junction DNA helicase RuvA [Desulfamplus sp.]|nr:Holliday junction DNA helicase RuvA [Desulfamplus sp.]